MDAILSKIRGGMTEGMMAMEGGAKRKKGGRGRSSSKSKKKPVARKSNSRKKVSKSGSTKSSSSTKKAWVATKRKVTIKARDKRTGRIVDVKKTVYRNPATGELRVRKMVASSSTPGKLRATYVAF